MLIGELVKRTGLTKDTIRFYERKGLIKLERKQRRENNYKEYSEYVLERLQLIKSIKELGFTINEINSFLELWHGEDASCSTLIGTVEDKVAQIDAHIQRLMAIRSRLTTSLGNCKAGDCQFEKSVPSCLN
jgi:DNA-binding transcriptional MerR regulator